MPSKAAQKPTPNRGATSLVVGGYLRQARRPLASLAFVLPLLALYEGGVVVLGPRAVRNGADVWLRQFLDALGFTQYFLLPALTVGLLLAWHHLVHDRWRVSAGVLYVMFAECAVFGLVLLCVARVEGLIAEAALGAAHEVDSTGLTMSWTVGPRGAFLGRMLGYLGAGVYEEMLFRLLLFPPVMFLAGFFVGLPGWRVVGAVAVTSLLFSAAHYVGPHGDTLEVFSFFFRFTAGAFFAVLFVYRGFGIAAGTHALYDIFVSLG